MAVISEDIGVIDENLKYSLYSRTFTFNQKGNKILRG